MDIIFNIFFYFKNQMILFFRESDGIFIFYSSGDAVSCISAADENNHHSAEEVVAAVDRLEKRWGELFKTVFKSITVDNGTEFAYYEELERSAIGAGKRTKMYYCHPYSSWERGTNEVTNKMVRRKVPKGTNFDDRTAEDIQEVENWINQYPRRIHGYKSAAEMFEEELQRIS